MRPISATIHLPALAHNLAVARKHVGAGVKLHAVVKANAYGHGLTRVFPALGEADGLAVIELENAMLLRQSLGWQKELMVLEGFYAFNEIAQFQAHRISAVVHTSEQIDMLERAPAGQPIKIYLKFNSGMNRLGFPLSAMAAVAARVRACKAAGEIVFTTHFARADEAGGEASQLAAFRAALSACQTNMQIPAAQFSPISLANSAATAKFGSVGGSEARPGIMLYGGSPLEGKTADECGLLPVMHLDTGVIAIQQVPTGQAVGYGGAFVATRPTRIAVLAGGYADGYPRSAKAGTPVWVAGARVPMAGRVSMDKITVDVTDHPHVQVGSPAQFWGNKVSVDDVAAHAGTISYELLTALAQRVPVRVVER
jgi:alanine racemase